jgi:CTP:molybdopterin cytidylyltransferase MocA
MIKDAPMQPPIDALILAGRRAGETDPLAGLEGVAHKGLLIADGAPLIARAARAVAGASLGGEIRIAAPEDMRDAFAAALSPIEGWRFIDPQPSPAASVVDAIETAAGDRPLLVTTCDHALLTDEIVRAFIQGAAGADAAAACVPKDIYEARFPGSRRTFVKLKDFAFSGANLFWFRGAAAKPLAAFWRRLEQKRKNPLAMAMAIGPFAALSYARGAMTKSGLEALIEKRAGVAARLVALQYAQAAIDVDKPEDLDLVRKILARPAQEWEPVLRE